MFKLIDTFYHFIKGRVLRWLKLSWLRPAKVALEKQRLQQQSHRRLP